jgi:mRNA-degrading endonuclease toxin of MazEF toxin-antitoxin module
LKRLGLVPWSCPAPVTPVPFDEDLEEVGQVLDDPARIVAGQLTMRGLDWEVPLGPDDGLPDVCVLKPEWIRSVERSLLGPRLATLPEGRWPEVRHAIVDVLGLADIPS